MRPAFPVAPANALDDLRFIRQTLENSASFTAVPGWGMVGMAATALLSAALAHGERFERWMTVWLAEAVVALALAMWTMQRKARRARVPLLSGPGRRFLLNFMPPMLVGGVLTIALYRAGSLHAIPGMWLLLYGTAVVSGGAFSVRIVPAMGSCFMILGGLALLAPGAWENWFMLAGFCGLHAVFGYLIARRHGG
ncbi:MAG: hypothetical protein LAO06_16785 [Acidobacteriia bacterium]|nr:hypothetical protein [Terriglobia bacterium]